MCVQIMRTVVATTIKCAPIIQTSWSERKHSNSREHFQHLNGTVCTSHVYIPTFWHKRTHSSSREHIYRLEWDSMQVICTAGQPPQTKPQQISRFWLLRTHSNPREHILTGRLWKFADVYTGGNHSNSLRTHSSSRGHILTRECDRHMYARGNPNTFFRKRALTKRARFDIGNFSSKWHTHIHTYTHELELIVHAPHLRLSRNTCLARRECQITCLCVCVCACVCVHVCVAHRCLGLMSVGFQKHFWFLIFLAFSLLVVGWQG